MRVKVGLSAVYILISIILLCSMSACETKPTEVLALPSGATSFPMDITDQAGKMVRIEKVPEKVVTLAPSNTEIVYALGLEDRLVGVTEYCNYPLLLVVIDHQQIQ